MPKIQSRAILDPNRAESHQKCCLISFRFTRRPIFGFYHSYNFWQRDFNAAARIAYTHCGSRNYDFFFFFFLLCAWRRVCVCSLCVCVCVFLSKQWPSRAFVYSSFAVAYVAYGHQHRHTHTPEFWCVPVFESLVPLTASHFHFHSRSQCYSHFSHSVILCCVFMETLLRKYFKDDQLSDERNPRDAVGGQWADCGRGAGAVEPLPDTGIDDNTTVGCSEYTKSDGIENGTTDRQESGGNNC